MSMASLVLTALAKAMPGVEQKNPRFTLVGKQHTSEIVSYMSYTCLYMHIISF